MNTSTNARVFTQLDAEGWVGKWILTTGNRKGVVTRAHPNGNGSKLFLYTWDGSFMFTTDNEHATITSK